MQVDIVPGLSFTPFIHLCSTNYLPATIKTFLTHKIYLVYEWQRQCQYTYIRTLIDGRAKQTIYIYIYSGCAAAHTPRHHIISSNSLTSLSQHCITSRDEMVTVCVHSISSHIFRLPKPSTWSTDFPFCRVHRSIVVPIYSDSTIPTTDTWVTDQILDVCDKSFVAASLTPDTVVYNLFPQRRMERTQYECHRMCKMLLDSTPSEYYCYQSWYYDRKFVSKVFDHVRVNVFQRFHRAVTRHATLRVDRKCENTKYFILVLSATSFAIKTKTKFWLMHGS